MCGFVAIFGAPDASIQLQELKRANSSISHRGPDDEGFFLDATIGLGFRRLSILDLSQSSHQPFEDPESGLVLVFNGEIYNYVELREELIRRGHRFRSTGDTEVLLAAYKEWGKDCLSRLNGMWAFVIYDKRERSIFVARDRFGVKPLYYQAEGDRHIFASEIKAILAVGKRHADLDWDIASEYLLDGRLSEPDESNQTFYDGIREFPAGHALHLVRGGQPEVWRYWYLPTSSKAAVGDPIEEFSSIFEDAVKLRLRSDVPVGVCLSGGLDSSSIICQMARLLKGGGSQPIRAFSYLSDDFDESEQVQATVAETGAELNRLSGSGFDFLDRLRDVMWYHDEPLHSLNVLVSFELYRMASHAGIKVMLNGQGADETWAGYPSYFQNFWYELLARRQFGTFKREIAKYSQEHGHDAKPLVRQVWNTLLRNQLRRFKPYRDVAAFKERRGAIADSWFTPDLIKRYKKVTPKYESRDLDSELRRSVTSRPMPLYLRIEDRNSMAHSIETRLPFLDYRLVELAFRVGSEWKLRGPLNKYTLRKATKGLIPEVVRQRTDKMGFPVPAADWLAGPLYDAFVQVIGSTDARQRGIYNVDEILGDLEKLRAGEKDISAKVFRVVQLEMLLQDRFSSSSSGVL